ncbi:MAG: alpha/beta fold hydrolase [Actinomycetota bacterium]|nr:alpha/beta fold hydrolase [Actinomycetota bacterium]
MRAREPDLDGFVERDGVKIGYEVFGHGSPSILLLPTWSVVHSRRWKGQVAYLARHFRVITCDGPGNGRSDRPAQPAPYASAEIVEDLVAVLDATGTEAAIGVGVSMGAGWLLELAATHPDRVLGAVFVSAAVGLADPPTDRPDYSFDDELDIDEGWAKYNRHYWLRDWPGFLQFFMGRLNSEPHSTKQIEDAVGWGLETTPETIIHTQRAPYLPDGAAGLIARVRCPSLVVHGDEDQIIGPSGGERFAAALGCELVVFGGSGHVPDARDPVRFNLLVREFADRVQPPAAVRRWTRARSRVPRALYLSSPIGLGHALRDVAIAGELRKSHPEVEIDWLAQHPVTTVLQAHGERVHPASAWLASESAHIESESAEHDLHCFQAYRRMDEILVANFHVLHDVLEDSHYDLVVGDEAWDADYYWHENPELKRTAFAWLTDFVGWLPMPAGGEREAFLAADYNAEMIEQVERYPRVRDRAIFVGEADDIVPDRFGAGLPCIRDWVSEHYDFAGYITGFDPVDLTDRAALRQRLGYRPEERVCVVTVGGSGVGTALLRKVIAAFPVARQAVPDLRMVVVAGPRIDPASLPSHPGLEVHAYVDGLFRHLAACDLAVVQGGLTTCMELTANGRPFLYFPLRNHFEQNYHVPHRLDRYGAGRRMDYAGTDPDALAAAIAEELGRPVDYQPVAADGAARAAASIATLL